MTVERFKLVDYAELRAANGVGLENWSLRGGVLPVLLAMEQAMFWTVREEGRVQAIGGYWPLNDRVCEVSFFPSEDFIAAPKKVYRMLKQELGRLCGVFLRVQLNCRAEGKFVRFARALGFEEEGRMRGFGRDGADHLMMAIVRRA